MVDLGMDIPVPAEDGHFISEKHARIAELISEYNHELSLLWIPPERREPGDQPFAVLHSPLGRPAYIAMYADEPDERLLARLYQADNARGNVLNEVDAHNAAVRALQQKKAQEELEEAREISLSILKSPKSVYKHNGVKYT